MGTLKGDEGKVDYRVSSDGRAHQWCLADYCGKVHLAYAWVSTYCRKGDRTTVIRGFWVISIVIDSDRGHSYKSFKKNKFTMKIEHVT